MRNSFILLVGRTTWTSSHLLNLSGIWLLGFYPFSFVWCWLFGVIFLLIVFFLFLSKFCAVSTCYPLHSCIFLFIFFLKFLLIYFFLLAITPFAFLCAFFFFGVLFFFGSQDLERKSKMWKGILSKLQPSCQVCLVSLFLYTRLFVELILSHNSHLVSL